VAAAKVAERSAQNTQVIRLRIPERPDMKRYSIWLRLKLCPCARGTVPNHAMRLHEWDTRLSVCVRTGVYRAGLQRMLKKCQFLAIALDSFFRILLKPPHLTATSALWDVIPHTRPYHIVVGLGSAA